jgi:uncharacterized protein YjbI with pentapeptide repeats
MVKSSKNDLMAKIANIIAHEDFTVNKKYNWHNYKSLSYLAGLLAAFSNVTSSGYSLWEATKKYLAIQKKSEPDKYMRDIHKQVVRSIGPECPQALKKDGEHYFKLLSFLLSYYDAKGDIDSHRKIFELIALGLMEKGVPDPDKWAERYNNEVLRAYRQSVNPILLAKLDDIVTKTRRKGSKYDNLVSMNNESKNEMLKIRKTEEISGTKYDYLEYFKRKFESNNIFNSGITLKELFVEPEAVVSYKGKEEKGCALKLLNSYISKKRALMIESAYGMGKSSLCLKSAYDKSLEYSHNKNEPFPIFLKLRGYDGEKKLGQFVNNENGLILNSNNKYIFYFDGFDELYLFAPDTAKTFLQYFTYWYENEFKNSYFIIATRPTYVLYNSPIRYDKLPILNILQFNDSQQNEWVRKWNTHAINKECMFSLSNKVSKRIKELLGHPLLLYISAYSLKEWEQKGLENSAGLYEAYLQVINKEEYNRGYNGKIAFFHTLNITLDEYVLLLQEIAYFIFSKPNYNGNITLNEIKNNLKNENVKKIIKSLTLKERFDDVFLCYFFIKEKDGFAFAHQSMLEFLVARRMIGVLKEAVSSKERDFRSELSGGLLNSQIIEFTFELILNISAEDKREICELLKKWYEDERILVYGDINIEGYITLDRTANIRTLALILLIHLSNCINSPYNINNISKYLNLLKVTSREHYNLMLSFLQGANLKSVDLEQADLKNANLMGANFQKANLQEANMFGANLRGADLYGTYLKRANLQQADLEEARIEASNLIDTFIFVANLRNADLHKSVLSGASLQGSNLQGANLSKTDLRRTNLRETNLEGADLSYANLEGADLYNANLYNANFTGANINFVVGLSNENYKELLKKRAVKMDVFSFQDFIKDK